MKYDPAKAYPHPVLRPSDGAGDYPRAEFQVTPYPERIEHTTVVRIWAEFALSDPDLRRLVDDGAAEYVLLVRAPGVHYRSVHASSTPLIEREFANGELAGRLELRGLLVALHDLSSFRAEGWHEDFGDARFDIAAGSVLAEDWPYVCYIDNAEEAAIGSIFEFGGEQGLDDGQWRCDLQGQKVSLRMSPTDCERFKDARNRVDNAAYVMNGVYLPALVYALQQADHNGDEYVDHRWYRSLNARLAELGLRELGDGGADRLADAQRLFEEPFGGVLRLWVEEAP